MGNKSKRSRQQVDNANMIRALREANGQFQQSFLNVKNMYDQKVMETASLTQKIIVKDQLITALVLGGPLVVPHKHLASVTAGEFVGYDLDLDEETRDITITAIKGEPDDEVQMTHFESETPQGGESPE